MYIGLKPVRLSPCANSCCLNKRVVTPSCVPLSKPDSRSTCHRENPALLFITKTAGKQTMKTDSFFHRFFREFRGAFFTLIGEDERKAEHYDFTAVEAKEQAFRFDGIFLPQTQGDPLFFFEAQFGLEDDFYLRYFDEIAVYLRQKKPAHPWRAIVLFPSAEFDPGVHPHYQEFFESGRIRRLYLIALPQEKLEKFPLNLLRIIIDSKQQVLATAEKIIQQLPEQVHEENERQLILDLLVNLLMGKFPQLSRKEIDKMLEPMLSDIRKSRAYQEVAEEITQELRPQIALAEKREIAATLLRKKMSLKFISEVTGLSPDEIRLLKKPSVKH